MSRHHESAVLQCENLESREVPAIVLPATANAGFTDAAPNGGFPNIIEIALVSTQPLFNRNGTVAPGQTKSAFANDTVSFSLSGSTLTINCSDGIFGQVGNVAGNPVVTYGNTLTVDGIAGFALNLQLGGDDNVVDNTPLRSTLIGGPGNDAIIAAGAQVAPALVPFLFTTGTLNVAALPVIGAMVPPKTLSGGPGNDNLTTTDIPTGFIIDGSDGNDTLTGALLGVFNTFTGGTGNDTIIGGLTVDVMDSGAGTDTLVGFGGGDYYISADLEVDFDFNQPNEFFIFADSFDFVAFR
jgi:Ca2+-binding RTX toxin-like protein